MKKSSIYSYIIVFAFILFLLSGCFNPFGNRIGVGGDLPEGFVRFSTITEDDISVTQYMGSGDSSEITDFFVDRAIKNGWSRLSEGSFRLEGYFDGMQFEKGNEVMILNVMSTEGQIIVQEIVGNKPKEDATVTPSPSEEESSSIYPPQTDVEGNDPENLSRFPGSVRVEYESLLGVSSFKYLVSDATAEDIFDYFSEDVKSNQWENIVSQYSESEITFIVGERDDEKTTLSLLIEEDNQDGIFKVNILIITETD